MSSENKLIATAAGSAIAGAALAVAAMKLIESSRDSPHDRPRVKSVLMNDPLQVPRKLERQGSEQLLFPYNHEEKMKRRIAHRFSIEEENITPRESVTVRVPATSANMGPGCKWSLEMEGRNKWGDWEDRLYDRLKFVSHFCSVLSILLLKFFNH